MTRGLLDTGYQNIDDTIYKKLVLNNGIVRYYKIPGLGHDCPNFSQMKDFQSYFEKPTSPGVDCDIVEILVPEPLCSPTVQPICMFRNVGIDTIRALKLSYTLNGVKNYCTWNGVLPSFSHSYLSIPALSTSILNQTVNVEIDKINSSIQDTISNDNNASISFKTLDHGIKLPYLEHFDNKPINWIAKSVDDDVFPWNFQSGVIFSLNSPLINPFENSSSRQDLISPPVDLTSISPIYVTFKIAYNYFQYTPPKVSSKKSYGDTLEVSISTDCGNSYTVLYKKGGSQLSTFNMPIINPLTAQACLISPEDSNYRTESIDLNTYKSFDGAILKFSYISGEGGMIILDDIHFHNSPLSIDNIEVPNCEIYPNPAQDKISISHFENIERVEIVDITGRGIFAKAYPDTFSHVSIDVSSFKDGIYLVRLVTKTKEIITKKILIAR